MSTQSSHFAHFVNQLLHILSNGTNLTWSSQVFYWFPYEWRYLVANVVLRLQLQPTNCCTFDTRASCQSNMSCSYFYNMFLSIAGFATGLLYRPTKSKSPGNRRRLRRPEAGTFLGNLGRIYEVDNPNLKADLCTSHFGPPWFCRNGRGSSTNFEANVQNVWPLNPDSETGDWKGVEFGEIAWQIRSSAVETTGECKERIFMAVRLDSLFSSMLTSCSRAKWNHVVLVGVFWI